MMVTVVAPTLVSTLNEFTLVSTLDEFTLLMFHLSKECCCTWGSIFVPRVVFYLFMDWLDLIWREI